ncbi:TPA: baseplate protein [Enterobacter hormaechei subsp. xiangfangensis]|nr:baseplate protein [Enterobacter hormaechei subsp. xiangfangensis]HAV1890623.1 baseplate protein [Enterobacter hormaechei subsp. xiangfangensis]
MSFDQLYALFNQSLQNNSWWKRFTNSQFIKMIAVFGSQIIYFAQQKADRSLTEGFISTATKRSSILAAAEDLGYVGRLILASSGTVTMTNKGTQKISLPLYTAMVSEKQLPYVLMEVVELQPGETRMGIKVRQMERMTVSTQIQNPVEFFSVMLSKEITQKTVSVEVYVTSSGKKELWTENPQFRLANSSSKNYVRFYKPTEQLGVRFGDGTIGMMPPANSQIDINVWTSQGDTTLTVGQRLRLTGIQQFLDAQMNIMTDSAITGGAGMESTEETRNRAMYYVAYDNQVIWGGDYEKFIKDSIADLSWINIWGEQQQEQSTGVKSLDNINSIFICAHIPGLTQAQLETRITDALKGVPNELNKKFKYVAANEMPYTVEITGTAYKNYQLSDIETEIKRILTAQFGKDAKVTTYGTNVGELFELAQNDIWDAIQQLNMMVRFTVKVINLTPPTKLNDFNYLDVAGSTFKISYPKVL